MQRAVDIKSSKQGPWLQGVYRYLGGRQVSELMDSGWGEKAEGSLKSSRLMCVTLTQVRRGGQHRGVVCMAPGGLLDLVLYFRSTEACARTAGKELAV